MALKPRVLIASLIVSATACGLVYDVDSLEKGEGCGEPGQECCSGKCNAGAHCVVQSAAKDGGTKDAGTASCACKDAAADQGSADAKATNSCPCTKDVCEACGNPGGACCDREPKCNGKILACANGRCGGCGEAGQACCDTKVSCVSGSECGDAGLCTKKACGHNGEPCCTDSKCDEGSCTSGKCVVTECGSLGQPCCSGACSDGSVCNSNKCEPAPPPPCGAQGEACCSGDACNGGLSCQGTCQPCGAQGQACCPGNACGGGLTCAGTCQPCGTYGLLCCAGICDGYSLCDGTYCKQCCGSCKNFGQITVDISWCQSGDFSTLCRNKNNCGTGSANACCPAGTCTNPNGNGLCH